MQQAAVLLSIPDGTCVQLQRETLTQQRRAVRAAAEPGLVEEHNRPTAGDSRCTASLATFWEACMTDERQVSSHDS